MYDSIDKINLWFFRDLNDDQRSELLALFGLYDVGNVNHGYQKTALKQILLGVSDKVEPEKTPTSEPEKSIYLVSGLVESPGKIGHRAQVGLFASKAEAIGTALEIWQVNEWSVVSYECGICDHLIETLIEKKI